MNGPKEDGLVGAPPRRRRVALLGAGYIAEFHTRALRTMPNVELVAVCDASLPRADSLAASFGIAGVFSSLTEMLSRARPEVVHVLLPPPAHARAAIEALEAGAHVLLEKPMATSSEDCESIREAARKAGRVVGTGHNFLFFPAYERLRRDSAEGRLGQIDQLSITWSKFFPQARSGPFDAWVLRDPKNILLEVCPHSFAHWVDLLGEPDKLEASADSPVELPSGGRFYRHFRATSEQRGASVEATFSFVEGYPEHRVVLRGTLASAVVDFERNTYECRRHRPLSVDFNRFMAITSESFDALGQATRTLSSYVLAKAKLGEYGAPFQASLTRAIETFHAGLDGGLDDRLAPELSLEVVRLAERVGRAARLPEIEPKETANDARAARKPATVLVTGGTGFIGRALVKELVRKGHAVRLVTRSVASIPADLRDLGLDIAIGSLRDRDFLARILPGIQSVLHLARSYGSTWDELRENDVEMTRTFADACERASVKRFVYASSIAIYYLGGASGPVTEETPPDPAVMRTQPYARAKVACEELLSEMHRTRGFPSVVVRPGIVIGSGGNPCHWGVAMWPYRSVCETWGTGEDPLPIVLVTDVADALVRCIEAPGVEGQSFNLVGDATLTAREYLDAMEQSAHIRLERRTTPIWRFYATDVFKWAVKTAVRHPNRAVPSYRAWEGRRAVAPFDCGNAKRLLGWRPTSDRDTVVAEGIQKPTAEYFG